MGAAISAQGFVPSGQALPLASDGTVISSAVWSEATPIREGELSHPLSCSTSFSLHLGSFSEPDVKSFFIGRGTSGGGFVRLVEHERTEKDDSVRVDIEARLRDPDELESISVVSLRKEDGSQGVGIYTLQRIHFQIPIVFHTTISFPRNNPKDQDVPSYSLRTITSNTTYDLELPNVQLRDLSIESSNKPIRTRSPLVTDFTSILSSNATVSGDFSARNSLGIVTSNGAIGPGSFDAPRSVSLTTSNAKVSGTFSTASLQIKTSNNPIDLSSVTFTHPSSSITLQTSNSPVNASIKFHPSASSSLPIFSSSAITSASDSDAPPSYEAAFSRDSSAQSPSHSSIPSSDSPLLNSHIATSNAPLTISYELFASSSSSPAQLRSNVKTSNAPIKVQHLGFQGMWDAKTSNAKVEITGRRVGEGESSSTKGKIGEGEGMSSVVTSNAPVQLRFD